MDIPKIPAAFQTIDVPTSEKSKLLSQAGLQMAAQFVELISSLVVQAKMPPRIITLGAYCFYLVSKRMIIDQNAEIQATFYEDASRLMDLVLTNAPKDVKDSWEKAGESALKPS